MPVQFPPHMRRSVAAALSMLAGCDAARQPDCAMPPAGFYRWNDPALWEGRPIGVTAPHYNIVTVEGSGRMTWNGADADLSTGTPTTGETMIERYLSLTSQMLPHPFAVLDFDVGTPCASVRAARALIDKHLDCQRSRMCVQGKGLYGDRDKPASR